MNALDGIIVVAALSAAAGGYRLGFMARVTSWIGLALGLYIAARLLPAAMRTFSGPDPTAKLMIAAVLLIGGGFLGQAVGLLLGSSIMKALPLGPLRLVDRGVGAFVGAIGVLAAVWLLLPAVADVPGAPSRQARSSTIAQAINDRAPRPPDTLKVLRRLVGETSFPQVFDALRPAPETGPPPENVGLTPAIVARVTAATVKVSGQACSRIQEGSGFAAGPDTVVTNAHVVAGEKVTTVLRPDGKVLKAQVVVFDPNRDLAVLRVPGLGQQPLAVSTAKVGAVGAVFGHPNGQDQLRIAPAKISQQVEAIGRDIYDSRATRRDVFIVAAALRPGDSGAALVDPKGDVVGVAFAVAPDRPGTAYALTDDELRQVLAQPTGAAVPTGPCLNR